LRTKYNEQRIQSGRKRPRSLTDFFQNVSVVLICTKNSSKHLWFRGVYPPPEAMVHPPKMAGLVPQFLIIMHAP